MHIWYIHWSVFYFIAIFAWGLCFFFSFVFFSSLGFILVLLHSLITISILSCLVHVFCSTLDGDDNHVCCFVSFVCLFALPNRSDSTKTSFHLNSHIQTSDQDYFMCIWLRIFYTDFNLHHHSGCHARLFLLFIHRSVFFFFYSRIYFSTSARAQSLNGSCSCIKCSTQFSHYF